MLELDGFPAVKVMFIQHGRTPGSFLGLALTDRPPVFRKGTIEGYDSSYYKLTK